MQNYRHEDYKREYAIINGTPQDTPKKRSAPKEAPKPTVISCGGDMTKFRKMIKKWDKKYRGA